MKLHTEVGFERDVADDAELRAALTKLDSDGNNFAILSTADETYIQTALYDDGFEIEKREGSQEAHFTATRPGLLPAPPRKKSRWNIPVPVYNRYSLDETVRIFCAYLAGAPEPFPIAWMPTDFSPTPAERTDVVRGLNIFFWIVVAIGVAIFLLIFLLEA